MPRIKWTANPKKGHHGCPEKSIQQRPDGPAGAWSLLVDGRDGVLQRRDTKRWVVDASALVLGIDRSIPGRLQHRTVVGGEAEIEQRLGTIIHHDR